MDISAVNAYCGHCGEASGEPRPDGTDHTACDQHLAMEPPRYCAECRRRLKVQVRPRGWTATCVEHGTVGR